MAFSTWASPSAPPVGFENELAKAIEEAHARATLVYASGSSTLVSEISSADWKNWDASSEDITVSDDDGLNDVDLLDLDCDDIAA